LYLLSITIAYELAAYFYKEQGNDLKSQEMFKQARDAYTKWGALKKADMIKEYIS
jgi:hypothetical protein